MSYTGADVEVAIVPNSNAWTSHTAESIGATHGLLPLEITAANQRGETSILTSIGNNYEEVFRLMKESVELTITGYCHHNGPEWAFLANIMGDATKSGTTFPVTNTFNWQQDALSALTYPNITVVYRINSDNNLIIEHPNVMVTQWTFQNYDGLLGYSVTLMNDTTLTGSDATNGSTEFTALTYNTTDSTCIDFNNGNLYIIAQGSDPTGGTLLSDCSNMQLSISRPYLPMDDVLRGFTTATDSKRRAQPLWDGNLPDISLSYDLKTMPDAYIDLIHTGTELSAELLYSQDIGGNTHTITIEMGRLRTVSPPDMPISRFNRIGQSFEWRLAKPSSAPTGHATANPIHIIMIGNTNWTFETLAA